MGKKGKGKKGSGDSSDQPSTSTTEQPSQSMKSHDHGAHQQVAVSVSSTPQASIETTVDPQLSQQQPQSQGGKKGKKGKQQQQPTQTSSEPAQIDPKSEPPIETIVDTQQQPQSQGGKKGKKGKQQQQPTQTSSEPAQIDPKSEPSIETIVDTQKSQQQPQSQGGKKGKKGKQQQPTQTSSEPAQIDPKSEFFAQPADASKPAAIHPVGRGREHTTTQQQQPSAWGRGHTSQQQQPSVWGHGHITSQQQQQIAGGHGSMPQQQQQPSAWGRGHSAPIQQQQQPSAWGRGQVPQQQQQQQTYPQQGASGRGVTPPPQQQQQTYPQQGARGRGVTPPPQQQQQQQTYPQQGARGRGVTPAPQQQQQQQTYPQQGARGRGVTPPPQQQQQQQTYPQQGAHGRGVTPPPEQQQQQQTYPQQGARGRGVIPPPQQQQQQQTYPQQGAHGRGQGDREAVRGRGVESQFGHVTSATPDVKEKSILVSLSQPHIGSGDQQQQQGSRAQQAAQCIDPAGDKLQLAVYQRKNLAKGGTKGRSFFVETNHVPLNIKPSLKVAFHYDVTINPDRPKRMMRRVWDVFRDKNLRRYNIAFDDVKNAYSPDRFHDTAGEVSLAEDENSMPKTYSVCIKFAAEVDLCSLFLYMQRGCRSSVPQEALQCLDIVLRNVSALRFVRVGRSYFSQPRNERIVSLGDGLELWHGFFQSAIIGWKPFLNVDVAHKGFPKPQNVVALMGEMSDQRTGDFDRERCTKFLKGLKVQYEIPNQTATRRTYRVNGFVQTPEVATFVQDGNRITIFNYYQRQKNYTIRERQLPCLWVGARDRHIYLPPELCTILPGQVINRKLNDIQTSNMVRNAATDTQTRKQKIMNSLQTVQFNNDPVVKAFGLTIGNDFEKVPARLLDPPSIGYKQRHVRPAKGVWRAAEFLNAENLPRGYWTVVNLDRRTRDDSIHSFVQMLKQGGSQLGMQVEDPEQPFVRMDRFDQKQFGSILQQHKNKKLIFVVVPDYPTNVYSKVKQISELEVGCVTQCIKSKTMFKMNPATVGNILLKVNAKLNGNNHTISRTCRPNCLRRPCMIMGADVTHPSPDQNDIPSVAAVTASCDATGFRYNFSWRLQPARQEIIIDLENIVREQLGIFESKTHVKPERIIFFRDGVSEGQFREVMNMEVQAIRRACSGMGTPNTYKPQITFLVVQKRHHTRFFPTNKTESEDRNFNVRAGTVVDTEITHPTGLEYYLVSHASIQGVARPTKYRVLWDDSEMSEDELEELTYYLCHMFSRCTRSVSYPAPTYYAHLAAFRARVYLEGHQINLGNLALEQTRRTIRDNIRREQPMFYV